MGPPFIVHCSSFRPSSFILPAFILHPSSFILPRGLSAIFAVAFPNHLRRYTLGKITAEYIWI
ncbi:MAG: hypothetical protein ACXWG4_12215, partial [Thermoanaerobaculia bacterium]